MAFDMPAPLNYMLNIPDPSEGIRKNLQAALLVGQGQREQQAAQDTHAIAQQDIQTKTVAAEQAETERQNMLGFRQDFAANAANPTAGGNLALIKKYPQYVAQITGASKAISAEEAKQLQSIHAAGLAGARDVQADEIKKLAASYLNSKDPQQKAHGQSLMDGLKLQQSNPGAYDTMMGVKIADGIGGEEYGKIYGGVTKLPDEILKGSADARAAALTALNKERELTDAHNTALAAANASNATTAEKKQALDQGQKLFEFKKRQEQAAADKAEADARKAARDAGGLPDKGKEQFTAEMANLDASRAASAKAGDLIKGFGTAEMSSGMAAVLGQKWKKFWGSEDDVTRLRQQYTQVANSSIMQQLKGTGRITENEIELVGAGVPDATANPDIIRKSLAALKKVTDAQSELSLSRIKWIKANGQLEPAGSDFTIEGKKYKKGDLPPGVEAPAATKEQDPVKRLDQIRARKAELLALSGAR